MAAMQTSDVGGTLSPFNLGPLSVT